ncbi:hypothetical protein [Bacillus thuringiensis]|uniref:hypothetical protein n=1 Tax=Bacillus thuringiensis TaxID=1428 RepID=UPI0021D6949E|nr:hypothetical protein [Bacillus thuringiensis]MCU7667942.1 hypothetical protein [Bacillus thuringiensis]
MKKALILIGISASLVGCSFASNEPQEDTTKKVTEKDTVETENKKPIIDKESVENKPQETKTEKETKTEEEKETKTEKETPSTNTQPSTQEKTNNVSTDTDKDKKPQKDVVKHTTTGVFYGIADSNSIEVSYDNDVDTLLFNNKLYGKINEIPYEAKISFTYVTNENGQNVITEIDTIK